MNTLQKAAATGSILISSLLAQEVNAQQFELGKILGEDQITFHLHEDGNDIDWNGTGSFSQIMTILSSADGFVDPIFVSSNNDELTDTNNIGVSIEMSPNGLSRIYTYDMNNMADGEYAFETIQHDMSHLNIYITTTLVRKTGTNIKVIGTFKNNNFTQPAPDLWRNRPQNPTLELNTTNDGVDVEYHVPPVSDAATGEVSLDLAGQTLGSITAERNEGTSFTTGDLIIDETNGTIQATIPQSGSQKIIRLSTQHNGETYLGHDFPGRKDEVDGPTLGINDFEKDKGYHLSQNPMQAGTAIEIKGITDTYYSGAGLQYFIIDMNGRLQSSHQNHNGTITAPNQQGMYIIRIVTPDGHDISKKFIVK